VLGDQKEECEDVKKEATSEHVAPDAEKTEGKNQNPR
jgi:hypothetical protein